jgi:SAM-dependent methyltransferase
MSPTLAPSTRRSAFEHERGAMSSLLSYNKACCLEDFSHPALRPVLREVFASEVERHPVEFPQARAYRKHWEVGMAVRAMADAGVLDADAEVLGVGAGSEPTLFWLTSKVRRVFATDLYLGSGARGVLRELPAWLRQRDLWRPALSSSRLLPTIAWSRFRRTRWSAAAPGSMLVAPEEEWAGSWNPRRLVVQHMDARQLRYEDASFDAVFSSSSIEHFGTVDDVARSVDEMWRVLKPGGLLTLSTELKLGGSAPGLPGTLMFTPQELHRLILDRRPWSPLSELDVSVSPATLASRRAFPEVVVDMSRHVAEHGRVRLEALEWSAYPHIVLQMGALTWTSVHLALRKLPLASQEGR